MSGVDDLLAEARRNLQRVGPQEAAELHRTGALLVDIRPQAQRQRYGEIPGALIIERNVLEWRLDPAGPDRHPGVTDDPDRAIVVVCQEGYASSLAAASLQALGLHRATDLDGGFAAWAAGGLPTQSSSPAQASPPA